ncbi:MAG: hypothetical protein ACKVS6_04145 [Planctomycetota bacterium]
MLYSSLNCNDLLLAIKGFLWDRLLGYGGNGITFSIIEAEIIRDRFLDRKNCDAHIFRFGR